MTTWRRVALVALACAIATSARAQSAVNAGVDAFVRGDYQRAAEALAPIIDRWPMENDQMADFLMAAMYEDGLGVSQDYIRACALYVRADTAPRSPTEPPLLPAAELTGRILEMLGPDRTRECLGLSTVGFNTRFQPVTFNLGPAHWIKFELSNAEMDIEATIDYQFQQKTVPLGGMLAPGVRFLPIEHTELHAASSNLRHFIQIFTWQPAERGQWSLRWWVSEVVRDKLAGVTAQDVLTVKQPPADWTIDVSQLAMLRV